MTTDNNLKMAEKTKEIVLSFLNALNAEDFKAARKYVHHDFKFEGVLGSRNGADEYFNDMEKMKLKYNIKKSFVDENDVCVIYDFVSNGITTSACGLYHLNLGKLSYLKVIFDPRVLIESQKN